MANFYTILTEVGKAKIANSQVTGKKVDLSEMAIGDGKGELYDPVDSQIELKNEVWRGSIGSIEIDSDNPNWIVIETIIPAETGGFTVREAGLFDETGDLIAIGKYPETYKPVLDEGSAKDLYIRMIIEVTNTSSVTLKIDPAVTIASRKYVDEKFEQVSYPVISVNDKTGNVKLTAEDVGAETPENSTEKANTAEQNANNYTDEAKKQLQSEIADTSKKDRKYTDDQVGKVEVPVISVNDKTGAVTITKTDVGLGNVGNVKQASKEEHDNLQKEVTSHKTDYTQHIESSDVHGIGRHDNLKTTSKNTIVQAINELYEEKESSLDENQKRPIYIQSTAPENPSENDIWIEIEPEEGEGDG